jgi:hypothetical protein
MTAGAQAADAGAPATAAPRTLGATAVGTDVVAKAPAGAGKGARKTVTHLVSARGTLRAAGRTSSAGFVVTRGFVRYVDSGAHLRFTSTKVTSVAVQGRSATLVGVGVRNGKRGVPFRVVLVAGPPGTIAVRIGRYTRSGPLAGGTVVVR